MEDLPRLAPSRDLVALAGLLTGKPFRPLVINRRPLSCERLIPESPAASIDPVLKAGPGYGENHGIGISETFFL